MSNFNTSLYHHIRHLYLKKIDFDQFNALTFDDKNIYEYIWRNSIWENMTAPIEGICEENMQNPKALSFFNHLLRFELLPQKFINALYQLNHDKNLFYQAITSYTSLIQVENAGIDIWKNFIIKGNEHFIPLYALDKEMYRKDLNEKISPHEYYDFFHAHREKWISHSEIASSVGYLSLKIFSSQKICKDLNIKINQEHIYQNHLGSKQKIVNLLIYYGLIKMVDKNAPSDALSLMRLVHSRVPMGYTDNLKFNQTTMHKKFAQLWIEYRDKTDFLYQDDFGNLANHTFKQKSFYLPLLQLDNTEKFSTYFSQEHKNNVSLHKWLCFLLDKKVDFHQNDANGKSALCCCMEFMMEQKNLYNFYFKDKGIIDILWQKSSDKQKECIASQFMETWKDKKKYLEEYFLENYNAYAFSGNPENVIEILVPHIKKKEHLMTLYDFFASLNINDEKSSRLKDYMSQLQMHILEKSLVLKKDVKTIKI